MVFLDIETTGSSPVNSRVLEIGALRIENGSIVDTFETFLQPETRVPSWITKLTGIHDEMVWDAPLFAGIADDLEYFLRDAIFVAHNVAFDYGFIASEYARLGRTFDMDRLCTVRLSRSFYPDQPRHNLDTIINTHNLVVQDRHRAMSDAHVLYQFYEKCKRTHGDEVLASKINTLIRPAKKPLR